MTPDLFLVLRYVAAPKALDMRKVFSTSGVAINLMTDS